ncbi:hypothetical protein G3M48_003894 [Beauveria asiatica]|uniref:Para-hydroxybenzoate--polyprenyltransferase n=1 Tax=Beauveria asiatica TaxID=1069075 RepID=A0AAW0RUC3_9HYPO
MSTVALTAAKNTNGKPLAQQYGGHHSGSWVNALPAPWVPYVQLSRLSPPAGFILIFLPHIFGVIHAASVLHSPIKDVFRVSGILLVGSFFCNNGSHAWNDLVDAPIDARIERTKTRPIPRGAISKKAAFVFACTQAALAAVCLLPLPYDTAVATIPALLGTLYYPYAKRHMPMPQLILGFCMTWGIMIGSSAMGVNEPWFDKSTICLMMASVLWVVLFDTIYAHQDLADDIKVGVKSLAVFVQGFARTFLLLLTVSMSTLLYYSGVYGGMGTPYQVITVAGCSLSVGIMVASVDLMDPASCWKWFANGFWFTGLSIVGGLLERSSTRLQPDGITVVGELWATRFIQRNEYIKQQKVIEAEMKAAEDPAIIRGYFLRLQTIVA